MQREGKSLSEVTQDGWSCPDSHRVATGSYSERRLCSTGQEQGLPRRNAGRLCDAQSLFPKMCVPTPPEAGEAAGEDVQLLKAGFLL